MRRGVLPWLLPSILVLSGCLGTGDAGDDLTINTVADPGQPTSTEQPTPTTNQPPTNQPGPGPTTGPASIPLFAGLVVPTTFVTSPIDLPVTLRSDRDDILSWSFDGDGDGIYELQGRRLPHTTTVPITDAGTYALHLLVEDAGETANARVTVTADFSDEPVVPARFVASPLDLTLAPSVRTGPAPLAVTFTVDGAHAGGAPVTWALDLDGDGAPDHSGDTLPAQVEHTYDAGAYLPIASLSDGSETITRAHRIIATVPEVPPPQPFDLTVVQDLLASCIQCTPNGPTVNQQPTGSAICVGIKLGEAGLDCGWIPLPPEAAGAPFTTGSAGEDVLFGGDVDLVFTTSCDPTDLGVVQAFYNAGHESGTVPAGAGCMVYWEWSDPQRTVTVTFGDGSPDGDGAAPS